VDRSTLHNFTVVRSTLW